MGVGVDDGTQAESRIATGRIINCVNIIWVVMVTSFLNFLSYILTITSSTFVLISESELYNEGGQYDYSDYRVRIKVHRSRKSAAGVPKTIFVPLLNIRIPLRGSVGYKTFKPSVLFLIIGLDIHK